MRVVLALLILAPLAATFAIKSGVDRILPLMIAMSLVAIVAHIYFEMRSED